MSRRVARPTRLRPADVLGEAVASIVGRPGRAAGASIGTLLGATWFVAMLGLVSTASGQVAISFTERLATVVLVSRPKAALPVPSYPYPADVQQRLDALPGVRAAGVFWQLRLGEPVRVTARPTLTGQADGRPGAGNPAVIAVSLGYLAAARVRVSPGRSFGAWDLAHAVPVCLVGALAARSLGISGLGGRPTIAINQVACAVIGIVGYASARQPILRSVLLPSSAALALWGPPDEAAGADPSVLIRTKPGAAAVVARQAPFAISPANPQQFVVTVPPAPIRLADQVTGALASEYVLLGWLGLGIGCLVIAMITMISVLHRAGEFGLRRAVGARRRHIAAQVLAESAILGLIGGLAGTSLGVAVVVIVAFARGWAPVIEPGTVLYAPLVAAAAGVLAGLAGCVPGAWMSPARTLNSVPPD